MEITNVILRKLNGTATAQEQAQLDSWLSESDANRLYFDDIKSIENHAQDLNQIEVIDTDQEWSSFMQSIEKEEQGLTIVQKSDDLGGISHEVEPQQNGTVRDIRGKKSNSSLWKGLAVAASLLLVASLVFLMPDKMQDVYTTDEMVSIDLHDGTKVELNPNSHLQYPTKFDNSGKRIVMLEGDATFDVTSDPNRPFVINTGKAGTEVLGTVFNLKGTADASSLEVIEGKVKLFDLIDPSKEAVLNTGDAISYDGSAFDTLMIGGVDFKNPPKPEPVPEPEPEAEPILEVEPAPEVIEPEVVEEVIKEEEVKEELKKSTFPMEALVKFLKSKEGFKISRKAKYKKDKKVEISINESLEVIFKQLEEYYEIEYKDNCTDCFEIEKLTPK